MNNLKNLRKENNLLQKDIANKLNIKQNTYSRYENEERDMSIDVLKRLTEIYNVSIDYLLCLTNKKDSYSKSNIVKIDGTMNRLSEIRENLDMTQYDIANILKINRSTCSIYENGVHNISTDILKKLALFYNVPIDYLLYLTDERTPYKRK